MLAVVAFVVALGSASSPPPSRSTSGPSASAARPSGLAVSSFAFFRFVSAFGGGALVERFGERVVLTAGLVVVAVTTGAAGLVDHFPAFLASARPAASAARCSPSPPCRSCSGSPARAPRPVGGHLPGRVHPRWDRGPAAGGLLAALSPRLPFLLYAAFLLLAGAVALVLLRTPATQTATPDTPQSAPPLPLATALRNRAYVAALVVNFGVGWMLFGVRNSLVPLYVTEDLGRTVAWAGAGLLVGSVAQAVGLLRSGRLVDGWGRRPSLVVGTALATGSVALLVGPPSTVVFLVSMAVFGPRRLPAGQRPPRSSPTSARPRRRVVAVFQMASDSAASSARSPPGALTDAVDYQLAFGVTAAVLAAGLVAALPSPGASDGDLQVVLADLAVQGPPRDAQLLRRVHRGHPGAVRQRRISSRSSCSSRLSSAAPGGQHGRRQVRQVHHVGAARRLADDGAARGRSPASGAPPAPAPRAG